LIDRNPTARWPVIGQRELQPVDTVPIDAAFANQLRSALGEGLPVAGPEGSQGGVQLAEAMVVFGNERLGDHLPPLANDGVPPP
jgi:hypothetical protein